MRQSHTTLSIDTRGRGLADITGRISAWVEASGLRNGLLTVFVRHTSASLLIHENADRDSRPRSPAPSLRAAWRGERGVPPSLVGVDFGLS